MYTLPVSFSVEASGYGVIETERSAQQMLLQLVRDGGFNESEDIHLSNKNCKWVVSSALQKAIRRGLSEVAAKYAVALWNDNASYLVRRLTVIALEDIGGANLDLCVLVASLVSNVRWLRKNGGYKIIAGVVTLLAQSAKNRAACDITCVVEYDPEFLKKKESLSSGISKTELFSIMRGSDNMFMCQLVLEILCGEGVSREQGVSDAQVLREFYEDYEVPGYLQFIMKKGKLCRADRLHIGLLVNWLFNNNKFSLKKYSGADLSRMLNGVPEAAYDQHTRTGKRALAYFSKAVLGIKSEMARLNQNLGFLGSAVFNTEGIVFDVEAVSPVSRYLEEQNLSANCVRFHVSKDDMLGFYNLVSSNLTELRFARKEVLGV